MRARIEMQKEVTQKEDGRYLIYYHFTKKESTNETGGQQMGAESELAHSGEASKGGERNV